MNGFYRAAGTAGLLLFGTPERHGGAGVDDWRFSAVAGEEFARAGFASAGLGLAEVVGHGAAGAGRRLLPALHGGYGYMREYPGARDFVDARVQTIYGGTTEIMKEIIGRDLGL